MDSTSDIGKRSSPGVTVGAERRGCLILVWEPEQRWQEAQQSRRFEAAAANSALLISVQVFARFGPELLNGQATTDKNGRFRIASLVPRLKFGLQAPGVQRSDLTVEPGKDKDLGDLK